MNAWQRYLRQMVSEWPGVASGDVERLARAEELGCLPKAVREHVGHQVKTQTEGHPS